MFLEGLEEEELIQSAPGGTDPTLTDTQVHQSGGTKIIDQTFHADFSGVPGELAAFGLPERTI